MVLPTVAVLISAITYAVARQVVRQRRLAAAFAVKTRHAEKWATTATVAGVADRLVVVTDSSIYAFCTGLISPHIYVSEGLLAAL